MKLFAEKKYPMRLAGFREGWMNMKPALPVPVIDWIERKQLDIAYGSNPLQKLDVYYPNSKKEKYPLFVIIHGGGWSHMDKRDWHLYPGFFALEKGFMVASINYRLIPKHKSPAGINDCSAALEYLISHAEELDIDLSQVFLWGTSAGGNLGSITALKYAGDTRLNVRLMIAVAPALDMRTLNDTLVEALYNTKPQWLFKIISPFIIRKHFKNHFGHVIDFEKTPIGPYDASYYLTPDAPRFYFQYGEKDTVILPKAVTDFAESLREYGLSENDIVLDALPDAPHMGASRHFFEEDVILRYIDYCVAMLKENK